MANFVGTLKHSSRHALPSMGTNVHLKKATKLAHLFDAHCQLLGNLLDTAWNQGGKALEICSDYTVWGRCVYCQKLWNNHSSVPAVTWLCRPRCIHASDCRIGMTGVKHSRDAKWNTSQNKAKYPGKQYAYNSYIPKVLLFGSLQSDQWALSLSGSPWFQATMKALFTFHMQLFV